MLTPYTTAVCLQLRTPASRSRQVKADGSTSPEGCKAFVRTFPPTALPGIGAEIGSASENELTYTANRVQIFVGGYEYLLVDRLSQILRIDGKDYMSDINKLL